MKFSFINIAGLFFILVVVMTGCIDRETTRRLDLADGLLETYPDSTLRIVEEIENSSSFSEEETARISLLKTMGMLKTGYEFGNDSILQPAWEYYGESDVPSREAMLTHFAKAAIYGMMDSLVMSIIEFEKTENLVWGDCSDFYKGLSLMNTATLLYNENCYKSARIKLDRARDYIFKTNNIDKQIRYYDLSGGLYLKTGDLDKAERETGLGIKLADGDAYKELRCRLMLQMADIYSSEGEYSKALEIYESFIGDEDVQFSYSDSLSFIVSLMGIGDYEKSRHLFSSISQPETETDNLQYYMIKSNLYAVEKNYKDAYALGDSLTYYDNIVTAGLYDSDLESRLMQEKEKISNKRVTSTDISVNEVFLLLILLIIAAISFCLWKRLKKESNMDILDNVNSKSFEDSDAEGEKKEEYDKSDPDTESFMNMELLNVVSDQNKPESLADDQIFEGDIVAGDVGSLIVKRKMISRMIRKYNAKNENSYGIVCERIKIYKKDSKFVNSFLESSSLIELQNKEREKEIIIKKYRNEEIFKYLENDVMLYTKGLYLLICEDLSLSDDMKKLLVYDICGFNYRAISEILEKKTSTVSSMRSRLKQRIGTMDSSNIKECKRYIPLLG